MGELVWERVRKVEGGGAYRCPITPVLITIVLLPFPSSSPLLSSLKQRSVRSPMAIASSIPPLPVTAFAHPELITTARMPSPFLLCRISRDTVTGAAWNLFVVNTAAAAHGDSEAMSARSSKRVLLALTPTCALPVLKPRGYVPAVGTYFFFEAGRAPSPGAA